MKRVDLRVLWCGHCVHPQGMTRQGGGLAPQRFPAFVGVISHPSEGLVLFDTGYDTAFFEATRRFPEILYRWVTPVRLAPGQGVVEQLARLGHSPGDVRAIILSHFHGDHVAGLHHFPQARIYCARSGLASVRGGNRFSRARRALLDSLVPGTVEGRARFFEDAPVLALPGAFSPFQSGADLFGDGSLLAVDLPGHCPGHWGLALRTQQDRYVFLVADAAWSIGAIATGTPPPAFTTAWLGDTAGYRGTLSRLQGVALRETLILPSHCLDAAARSGLLWNDAI